MKDRKLDTLIEYILNNEELCTRLSDALNIDTNIELVPSQIQSKGKELYDVNVLDKQYELSIETFLLQNKKSFVEFNFRLKNYKNLTGSSTPNYGIETGITNTGDAKKVFDKIVSTIIVLINKKNPDYITFQAREEKRQRLYKYIVKQCLHKIGDYKEMNISPLTNDTFDESEFWLEKI